jgi:hypothetical protein
MEMPFSGLELNGLELDGYIYCLSNPSYDGIYKIGFTKNTDLCERTRQLYTTGVIHPFQIECAKKVYNCSHKEKLIHRYFDEFRVMSNREFFNVELDKIKLLFDIIDGDEYNINDKFQSYNNI